MALNSPGINYNQQMAMMKTVSGSDNFFKNGAPEALSRAKDARDAMLGRVSGMSLRSG